MDVNKSGVCTCTIGARIMEWFLLTNLIIGIAKHIFFCYILRLIIDCRFLSSVPTEDKFV